MPISTSVHISHCLGLIIALNPKSVLDVGCGFGMWGFLCRTYLDVMYERVQPSEWQVRIDGLESFEPYIQDHHRALYSSILIADIRAVAATLDSYELIIAGDVIEHLDKHDGELVLEHLYDRAEKALLVNIPLGEGWDHPMRHDNPGELHRSLWTAEDFAAYPAAWKAFDLPCGQYGVFYCPKDVSREERIQGLLFAANRYDAQGNLSWAARQLRRAHALDPNNREVVFGLADVLIRSGMPKEGAAILAEYVAASPADHDAASLLATLRRRLPH